MDVFGFGRRYLVLMGPLVSAQCSLTITVSASQNLPGKTDSTWISVARILAMFDIQKTLDAGGHEVEPDVRFTAGFTS